MGDTFFEVAVTTDKNIFTDLHLSPVGTSEFVVLVKKECNPSISSTSRQLGQAGFAWYTDQRKTK
jgi:hypothetical protein